MIELNSTLNEAMPHHSRPPPPFPATPQPAAATILPLFVRRATFADTNGDGIQYYPSRTNDFYGKINLRLYKIKRYLLTPLNDLMVNLLIYYNYLSAVSLVRHKAGLRVYFLLPVAVCILAGVSGAQAGRR